MKKLAVIFAGLTLLCASAAQAADTEGEKPAPRHGHHQGHYKSHHHARHHRRHLHRHHGHHHYARKKHG